MTRLGYQIPNFTYPDTQPGEIFDSETWKTKCVFILVQLLYTVVTLLPVVWLGLG